MTVAEPTTGIFDYMGVRPLINAAGPLTRVGGGPLAPEVVEAMAEAARTTLKVAELQEAAGRLIAESTGAESGYVTSGAAAGLTLSAAACIARLDPALMDRLPDTDGLPNEIVIQKPHAVSYARSLRAAGAKLVEAGYMGYPGTGATYAWQIEAAITPRTVALAYQLVDAPNTVSLEELVAIGRRHDLPIIVDAAAALPPPENLRRFVAAGAAMVCFSGGKAIGGPQASGILAGRADLVRSVALQHQDMDVPFELLEGDLWPGSGIPHHGIGRAMKVGKEEIVGLMAALRAYLQRDHAADQARWLAQVTHVAERLDGALGDRVRAWVVPLARRGTYPIAEVQVLDGQNPAEVLLRLDRGEPRVRVAHYGLERRVLQVVPITLLPGQEAVVADRLLAVLAEGA